MKAYLEKPEIKPLPSHINYIRILYMSVCFLVAYIGLKPGNNLIGVTLKNLGFMNLGFISLVVAYGGNTLSTLITPYILTRFNFKFRKLFFVGAFTFFILALSRK